MRLINDRFLLSPTDLADSLACRHKTTLELAAARGERVRPQYSDPLADVLRHRGMEHEARYVDSLRAHGLTVTDLGGFKDGDKDVPHSDRVARTVAAMHTGVDVIVQAPLGQFGQGDADWFGFADVLVKVPGASNLGDWHYEAHDTKLARETRAGAILQLCVYTELLAALQGRTPDHFHIVTPAASHTYRVSDVGAYYRLVRSRLLRTTNQEPAEPSYPDPSAHCAVCRWWQVCDTQRRADDHVQFVANLGRVHKRELETHSITKLEQLAEWEVPKDFRPKHGSRETFEKLQEQAALQKKQRDTKQPQYTLLPIEPHVADDGTALPLRGLKRLPTPSAGDLYLDLEGDPFGRKVVATESGEGSREYLFGLGWVDAGGEFQFKGWWAFDDAEERRAFEEVMDWIARVVAEHPGTHVYHYAPYEPSAFKRLSGRYASRETELDVMLRAGTLVDLYAVVRESVRAGVETYSIKSMEPFYEFTRDIDLRKAGHERQTIEIALESGDVRAIPDEVRAAVEGYNRDDVRSTYELQRWCERLRDEAIGRGDAVPRPEPRPGEPSEEIKERDLRVRALQALLLATEPPPTSPHFLVAHLLDWHRRENKSEWWEYYRLRELDDDSLRDERKAVSGLQFIASEPFISEKTGKATKSVVERYSWPAQDCDIKDDDTLNALDGKSWGDVVAIDRLARTIDVKVGPSRQGIRPVSAFAHQVIDPGAIAESLYQTGVEVHEGRPLPLAMSLLQRVPGPVHAIQGPPGTGKTYRGSVMICDLVAAGKTVGVTAHSHAVITNLLRAVQKRAAELGVDVPILQIKNEDEFGADAPGVTGGTAWHWCGKNAQPVDVLFVDEAGQMSLANVLACTRIAQSMVLLGDPQQLEQPTKGVHPEGTGVSALHHWLGEAKVMPADRGDFLKTTWRLAPAICEFTSECFYEGQLTSKLGLEHQVLRGTQRFQGAGLRVVPVDHDGNRNASDEEVAEVVRIVDELLAPGSEWVDEHGKARQITPTDIRIVAPYNAQVSRIQEGLARRSASGGGPDVPVGTVDKFQGQEAPVVIYSMATSRPEDAPRGLGFLYSLNRFNVATSRARCLCILVANPRLFEPDCQTPAQMQLVNALCRYRELSEASSSS